MNRQEFSRLRAYEMAKRFRFKPSFTPPSRRTSKAMSNATGQSGLKGFRIVSQVIKYIPQGKA